jgi:hydrogenase expression/formation protein HypE
LNSEKDSVILLAHGDGGKKSSDLVNGLLVKHLGNSILSKLEDSAIFDFPGRKTAFTTDSFTVKPVFFPGGDIGKLCVCGTVNDLAVCGCSPLALSLSLIIEEGFSYADLEKIVLSIKKTLSLTTVKYGIVTGDTKVVEKGGADGIFINTAGIGYFDSSRIMSPLNIKEGDDIVLNGSIAEHGISLLSRRPEFNFKTKIISDCAPLDSLISGMLSASSNIHALRDATRGGLARVLIEMAQSSGLDFEIFEENIPVKREARGICEFLGLDPLYIANEGKIAAFINPEDTARVIGAMKENEYGKDSAVIGRVIKNSGNKKSGEPGRVVLVTRFNTKRLLDIYYSEQLPRIC